ncbi:cytochrome P450 [Lentzea sp. NPDC051838]|uniref:cytochrome P450 n=1 Tax=Lentzea sp. NPDC051838 TaxID=3154849 RepID=UPI00343F6ABD
MRLSKVPGALPLAGHLHRLVRNPLDFLASVHEHGDLLELKLGPQRVFLPCHGELAGDVLRDSATFDKGGFAYDRARLLFGSSGIGTCDYAHHRTLRPLVQPAFARPRLERYADIMREEVDALVDSWHPGDVLDVKRVMDGLFCRVTARTLFSSDLGGAAVDEVGHCIPIIVDGVFARMMDPTGLWPRVPTPANRRFDDAMTRLAALTADILARHRRSGVTDHGDVLSALIAAGLSDTEIHEQIMVLLVSGMETTATTIAWTLNLLCDHPDVEDRMRTELATSERAEYTRRVINEVLRLYPTAWLFSRRTTCDTTLGGHHIPARSMIAVSPFVLHRDPKVFPDPARFDPDRFLELNPVQRQAYIPFGAGARKCIGDVFGMTQAVIALAGILSRWTLRRAPGVTPRVVPKAVLVPANLSLIAEARCTSTTSNA